MARAFHASDAAQALQRAGAVDVPEFCASDARADTLQRVASEIFSSLGSIGKVRMRLPVTAKIAFVTAVATAAVGEAT